LELEGWDLTEFELSKNEFIFKPHSEDDVAEEKLKLMLKVNFKSKEELDELFIELRDRGFVVKI